MKRNDYGNFSINDLTTSLSVDDVVKALRLQFEKSLLDSPISVGDVQVSLSKSNTGQKVDTVIGSSAPLVVAEWPSCMFSNL